MSFASFSNVSEVSFDFEETLVKRVPKKYKNTYQPNMLIECDEFLYHLTPFSVDILNSFLKQKISVSILASENCFESFVNKADKKIFKKLKSVSVDKDTFESNYLSEYDKLNKVFITGNKSFYDSAYSNNVIALGESFFHFDTFEKVKDEVAKLKESGEYDDKKVFLPTNELIWSLENHKLAKAYELIISMDFKSSKSISSSLKNLKIDDANLIKSGASYRKYRFLDESLIWEYNDEATEVKGCSLYSSIEKKVIKKKKLKDCIEELGVVTELILNDEDFSVKGCKIVDADRKAFIEKEDDLACLYEKEEIQYVWIGEQRKKCVSLYKSLYIAREESKDKCLFTHLVDYEDGSRKLSFKYQLDGVDIPVIPEIMNLKDGEVIPKKIYKKFSANQIAASIVRRIHINEEYENQRDLDSWDFDFALDAKGVIAFNYKYYDSINEKGFLNQHIVHHSNGCECTGSRAKQEDKMARLRIEETYGDVGMPAHNVRPKYSFLIIPVDRDDMIPTTIASQYGEILGKVKDDLLIRSTFTPSDSLNRSAAGKTRLYKSKDLLKLQADGYWENQVWGLLEMKDLEYILINCHGSSLDKNQIKHIVKTAKVPVHQCKQIQSKSGSLSDVMPGKRLN